MKKREMVDLILEILAEVLSGTDFRLKRSDDALVRKIHDGKQVLGLPVWDYNPVFEFSLNICIRLDAVEDVFHLFSGSPPKYRAMSYTTITRLSHFMGEPARFKVMTPDDAASVGHVLSDVIRETILPFFDAYQDVQTLDRVVNGESPGIDITLNPSGAMHAVILAHLAGNNEFDRLVAKHRTDMQLTPDVVHPFNRLVEYLKAR
jgi:hypothetical protein